MLESLFDKVAWIGPATLLKKDSNTGAFLGMLRNFSEEHLRTAASWVNDALRWAKSFNHICRKFDF